MEQRINPKLVQQWLSNGRKKTKPGHLSDTPALCIDNALRHYGALNDGSIITRA